MSNTTRLRSGLLAEAERLVSVPYGRLLAIGTLLLVGVGCPGGDEETECANGTCVCPADAQCDLTCAAPPCHVDCERGSSCTAACGNGDCTCDEGASCEFSCKAPPCHVRCAGNNTRCDGTCANGSCACGPNSTCHFQCASGPCHVSCAEGSTCIVDCPSGTAGTQNCDITSCAAGAPVVCPNGAMTVCGQPCP